MPEENNKFLEGFANALAVADNIANAVMSVTDMFNGNNNSGYHSGYRNDCVDNDCVSKPRKKSKGGTYKPNRIKDDD